ncbi:MAG: DUF2254 domain-containing protein, partial [Acidimicrobiia bacterium]|nr:DUF2254 domain-containing protein [Acidimicrobiia bacterium]
MIVRLRQIADDLRFGWSLIPAGFCVVGVVLAIVLLEIDAALGPDYWPARLQASAANARAILSTVAAGLISAVTLLLSLGLVAVQLGSNQFSPRTISNWLGDRVLQVAIGFVLGTVVFCLVTLQASDDVNGTALEVPHRAVFASLLLTVISLFTVVRSVDHLAKSLRIGTVAQTILAQTLSLIEDTDDQNQPALPLGPPRSEQADTGTAIESTRAGWIQQVDRNRLLDLCPDQATIRVAKPVGTFVLVHAPLAYVEANETLEAELVSRITESFAIGPTRTTQQDVAFGLLRLTDIAMRALSPGVNDPNTAIDILN